MTQTRRNPRPLDAPRLEELALAYVARFATSAAKLEGYLRRKLRERGWDGEGAAPVAEIVARFVAAGYIDDAVFARARTGSLLRRGYGVRRIGQALDAAGIAEAAIRAGCEFEYEYPYLVHTREGIFHLVYSWNNSFIKHVSFTEDWLESRN